MTKPPAARPPGRHRPSRPARRTAGRTAVLLLTALLVTTVGAGGWWLWQHEQEPVDPSTTPAAATPLPRETSPAGPQPVVLAISVDGLNPDALEALGPQGAPHFHRLVGEGAATMNARTAYELTITLPNHTGMLTGRGVAGHGVTFNLDNGGTLHTTHGSYVPGLFDVAHDRGLRTVFTAQKDKFEYLMRSWDQAGGPDVVGEDDGTDKLDVTQIGDAPTIVGKTLDALLDPETGVIFLHLSAPDDAGHTHGWLGAQYLAAVQAVDADLGRILTAIDAEPGLRDRATILLTSDHGGPRGAKAHDNRALLANYRVPFIAWGNGVAPGADLYELNPDRADPGTRQPDYSTTQPVRNIDIANTALALLGLPPLSGAESTAWPALRLE